MPKRILPKPTDTELTVLRALWGRGPSTVREVLEEVEAEWPVGYTTVLKIMQIMTAKGLLVRDTSRRTHVFRPALNEEQTQRRLVQDLLQGAFGGSSQKLVMRALSARKASKEEIAQIRKLLDELEGQKK